MIVSLNPQSIRDYERFLKIKNLPTYRFVGRRAIVPDEYAEQIGMAAESSRQVEWDAPDFFLDYQRDGTRLAIQKQKYALLWQCGLGKTLPIIEWSCHAQKQLNRQGKGVLIVSPLMVIRQTLSEVEKFYGDDRGIEVVKSAELQSWLNNCGGRIGITNWDSFSQPLQQGRLGAIAGDESSYLKSHYGNWANTFLSFAKSCDWVLMATGTPAPNDRMEFANYAVAAGRFPTVNSFLGTFFINRGQTQNRWEMRPYAIDRFYKSLSDFCLFIENPATYGWQDNSESIPPINVHIEHLELTDEQHQILQTATGELVHTKRRNLRSGTRIEQLAKGWWKNRRVKSLKPTHIRQSVESWPTESTIIWCKYNPEQKIIEDALRGLDFASITGATPIEQRIEMIDAFKCGQVSVLVSKPKILGFGLNLQRATRQMFSTCSDSYEDYWQCVKRSNRIGSTFPLNVHLPVTDIEEPMMQNVLVKADRIQEDAVKQEQLFKEHRFNGVAMFDIRKHAEHGNLVSPVAQVEQ